MPGTSFGVLGRVSCLRGGGVASIVNVQSIAAAIFFIATKLRHRC